MQLVHLVLLPPYLKAPLLMPIKRFHNVILLKPLRLIVSTPKNSLIQLEIHGWKNIKKLSTHQTYGKAATLLIDGRPLVASNKVLVLEYPLTKLAEKVNAKDIQSDLQTVINHIFKRKMFVYAVSRAQSIDLQALYMNLLQIGKLPKAKDVVLEFIGE